MRIEAPGAPPLVLEHPSVAEVREIVVTEHARVAVRRLNGWATALIVTGATIATAFTGLFVFALIVAGSGIAGG